MAASAAQRPAGVFVLGSGRSGTSAITRIVNLLGVPLAAEEYRPLPDEANRRGYWECQPLSDLNERVLMAFGGNWFAPPTFPVGWERDARLRPLRRDAGKVLARVHPMPQWVWKDPRTSQTLPFWLQVADVDPVVVLVYRHPLEVAESVAARYGLPEAVSLAIWERLNRDALASSAGLPTFVVPFGKMVREPARIAAQLEEFLRAQGLDLHGDTSEEIATFVEPSLHHARQTDRETNGRLSRAQAALLEILDSAAGAHASFVQRELPPETPWVEPLHDARRRAIGLQLELARLAELERKLSHRTRLGIHVRRGPRSERRARPTA